MRWLGYTADLVQRDLRWADWGTFGHVGGIRRTTGDPEGEPHDRAVIAAIGPLLAGVDLDDPSARSDAACVDANWADGWPLEGWRFISTEGARDLAAHEPFSHTWRLLVVALSRLGERYLELHGAEVDAFITSVLPDATSFRVGEPHAEAATSAGAQASDMLAVKVADAVGGLEPLNSGSPDPSGADAITPSGGATINTINRDVTGGKVVSKVEREMRATKRSVEPR
jgi:hypothetical protein